MDTCKFIEKWGPEHVRRIRPRKSGPGHRAGGRVAETNDPL